jgi:hypothetical protein
VWSLTLRVAHGQKIFKNSVEEGMFAEEVECGERRLKVFENWVLRRVFGPKRDEVSGEWRKLHNKDLNDLYSLPNIVRVVKSRRMRWTGHVARMGRGEVCTGFWWGSLKGTRRLGRPRHRWEDNIKMDLQEVGGGCGSVVVKALRYKLECPGIDSRCRGFFSDSSMCPGVDSASKNEYQLNPGIKAAGA